MSQTAQEYAIDDWCARYGSHPDVIDWLRRNPPPKEWEGTPTEWAYTEMITVLR